MLQWYILHMYFLLGRTEGNRKISLKVPYYTNFQIFFVIPDASEAAPHDYLLKTKQNQNNTRTSWY